VEQEQLDAESLSEVNVGSEYFINSQELEDKVRSLLPSQGGAGAGFDLSASTQIIPIIDLTESAEGSNVRQDLQTALSLKSITFTQTTGATTDTIITNTGYHRIFGTCHLGGGGEASMSITDGTTTKVLFEFFGLASQLTTPQFDFVVFVPAGVSITQTTGGASQIVSTSTRQIADINGDLVNP